MIGAYAGSGISGSGCHKKELALGQWVFAPDVNLAHPVFGLMGDAL